MSELFSYWRNKTPFIIRAMTILIITGTFLFTGCSKDEVDSGHDSNFKDNNIPFNTADDIPFNTASDLNEMSKIEWFSNIYAYLDEKTKDELIQARVATAKYRYLKDALNDGYESIDLVLPNVGYHYLKSSNLDATFDLNNPEILIYKMDSDGRATLVAVEYAIPIDLSKEAPEGFSGSFDIWTEDTKMGLWLLPAWIWYYNPDGLFRSKNPRIRLP